MARTRRPTQLDIARHAGVSPAVVSLVINDRANGKVKISETTQERVRAAIRELGYVPNMAARQLAGGRNRLLGVFTYEPVFPLAQESFYYPFLVGIEERAEELDFDLLLFTRATRSDGQRQIYRDGVNALQASDGAILLGTNEDRDELARLHRDGFPFVFVGRREIDGQPLDYVGADYVGAASELVHLLVEMGHRDIHYVSVPVTDNNESAADRLAGVHRGLVETALPGGDDRFHIVARSEIGTAAVAAWLEAGATAIVTQTLGLAHIVRAAAADLGLRVPGDLSVAALGNSDPGVSDDGSVTSIRIPQREMGAGSVELLVNILYRPDQIESRQITMPCSIAHGTTTGPPRP